MADKNEAMQSVPDVVERFMRYVQIPSQSDPDREDVTPSSNGQFKMADYLAQELKGLGLSGVGVDEHAYVLATLPASQGLEDLPALGLCAHIDTSFDAPADGIKPHIVHYEGGDLVAGIVEGKPVSLDPEEIPYLKQFVGQYIVCSDGTTLLSADDKAGVAEIVALLARLIAHPEIQHPTLKIAFVPDEEIGHGAELLDLDEFGAAWCYTVDGEEIGEFSYECFNAASAVVQAKGRMVHPGSAKNIMINAITLLNQFDRMLPEAQRPEYTEGHEGFFHPISIQGSAAEASCEYIIRDHDAKLFQDRQDYMLRCARFLNERYGEELVKVTLKQEYRNMAEKFGDVPFLIDNALKAYEQAGIEPCVKAIRGGTDGAQLTFRGLPCPNIATGGSQAHSVHEFIPVSTMEVTVNILENLVQLFAVAQKA